VPETPLHPATALVPEGKPRKLDAAVRALFGLSWNDARQAVRSGKVWLGSPAVAATDPTALVQAGLAIELRPSAPRPHVARRTSFEKDAVVYVDSQVVVVNKPSGISTVPFGDEDPEAEKETLDALVREILARRLYKGRPGGRRAPLGVVHRLDKDTSGLLVFTCSMAAKKHLSDQFRAHTPARTYLAIIHGVFRGQRTFRSHLVEDRGDGRRGSARPGRREGKLAVTHVTALEPLNGATLVSCRLETGRTHQIRIHLSEAGHPLVGERVYVRGYQGTILPAPRTMLHAAELGFLHPTSEEPLRFTVDPPADVPAVLAALRKGPP
jgi:23S rRNA pseudouridine1911/1915/1917 synthase